MSPQPFPSLSGFNPVMSRRVLLGGRTQRLRLLFLQG